MSGRGKADRSKGSRQWARVRCPHPECLHVGELITIAHCRLEHGMERTELIEKYGDPIPVQVDGRLSSQNSKIKTIVPNNNPVISGQKRGVSRS